MSHMQKVRGNQFFIMAIKYDDDDDDEDGSDEEENDDD